MIAKVFKQEIEIVKDLSPRKCGSFNGLTFEQIEEKFPDAPEQLINNPDIPTPSEAESISAYIRRVKTILNNLVENNIGGRIIPVPCKDVIKAAICTALNMPDSSLRRIYIKSGQCNQISYYERWSSLVCCDCKPL